jgi:hypothetical protein
MICDLNNVKNIVQTEGLTLLVVSYGGCCSNTLTRALIKNGYKCMSPTYRKILCHCPNYVEIDIPIIYIYDNPIKSFLSMKNRGKGYFDLNQQKMSNNKKVVLSDENLITLMINHFNSWTTIKRKNVLVIKSCELFEGSIVTKLETFLKTKLYHFPITFVSPKTDIINITDEKLLELFEKYKLEIDTINNYFCIS